ncbi:MAG TPA: phage tail protein [Candidatus Angelobacter sp.]|jgi:hypothetical protein|nr:phage tail protein [Candidatus Angelobacter sp.]
MAVPLPVVITAGALPLGFKGNLQQTLNAFADALSASVEATFLTGQIGGSPPTHDIGPWATGQNNSEWWFWDPVSGQYQPSEQGVPVGTIVLWGGNTQPGNGRWLPCNGAAVSRQLYSRLYQAIGLTWGAGDGATTFNLPPGGVFFINQYNFAPDATVAAVPGYPASGVNGRGGAQTNKIATANLPGMKITTPFLLPSFGSGNQGGYSIPNMQPDGSGPPNHYDYQVRDQGGVPLGGQNNPMSVMPPYCGANYIIKWQ